MGHGLTPGDLIALTASGIAAEKLHDLLTGMREDLVSSLVANTLNIFHKNEALGDGSSEKNTDATDLPTSITLVNSLKGRVNAHLASTGVEGTHLVASSEVIAAPEATDLATAQTLANEIKADYNLHLSEAGVHLVTDGANIVTAADATNQATLNALLVEIKGDFNTHIASVMATPPISDQAT